MTVFTRASVLPAPLGRHAAASGRHAAASFSVSFAAIVMYSNRDPGHFGGIINSSYRSPKFTTAGFPPQAEVWWVILTLSLLDPKQAPRWHGPIYKSLAQLIDFALSPTFSAFESFAGVVMAGLRTLPKVVVRNPDVAASILCFMESQEHGEIQAASVGSFKGDP